MNLPELFAWPEGLPLLLLAPAAWWVLRRREAARAREVERAFGPRAPRLVEGAAPRLRRLRDLLAAGGLGAALVAALGPGAHDPDRVVAQRGVDLLVALDVSRSMLARDVAPSRLEAARRSLAELARRARGDRLGLVVFAGDARLVVPLTQDVESFATMAGLADPQSVTRGGTDLGAALDLSLAALGRGAGDHEAIVLVTDGEDLGGRGLEAAAACKARGVVVHCAGIGSTSGSKIVVDGEGGGFLRDSQGQDVVSTMDPASLRRIAEAAGGTCLDAGARESALAELYETRILPMARKSFEARRDEGFEPRFQWPLLAALVLWLLELGIPAGGPRSARPG